ncbi:MAG TPA: serine/threonine-protein kinase [Pirellulales bacterium]|nr:serine/threonine-protein kinase [Pirellulales bacterium]
MSVSSQSLPETKDANPSVPYVVERPTQASHPGGLLDARLAATLDEMAAQWHAGQARTAEQWLAERPELAADAEAAVRVVYEEFCLREERGERVESAEYYRRFPQWQDALAVVLDCHQLLRAPNEATQFPTAGQQLGDLCLLEELGRGALGRVFLATQPSLSDRLLVVKVTARSGQEHLSLARLQHTNIVPLYLVHDFPAENLRALCMPYLGGATWASVLSSLEKHVLGGRSGGQIVAHLAERQERTSAFAVAGGPAIGFLSRSSYIDAVCWIGACLADALSYAHQRGLVHLDIKPSNVLLAGDGQPMLLDFHLACETQRLQNKNIDRLGGTPGYMSPEQRAATECVKQGVPIARPLDARSDIYSLGVLLYESLAGQLPPENPNLLRQKLRHANPQISRGLEDIVCKCLARTPAGRYDDAGQLAADLRCHLASLPLRGVGNHSVLERWQKWRRRKPLALPVLAISMGVVIVICGVAALYYRDHIRTAEAALQQSQEELANREFGPAIQHSQAAWNALQWFPGHAELKSRLKTQIATAQRAQVVAALHDLVEQLRFLDQEPTAESALNHSKLAEIATGCRAIWQAREMLKSPARDSSDEGANDKSPEPQGEEKTKQDDNQKLPEALRRDLLDLAILSARLDMQLASPAGAAEVRQQAIEKLAEARAVCGPSFLLDLEERDYRAGGNNGDEKVSLDSLPVANNAWEHDGLGRWLMHHGALDEARRQFATAIARQPDDFWAHFQQMRCDYQLGHDADALSAANVCIALAPQRAECYYNRALCHQALNHAEEAKADFSRAVELDPDCTPEKMGKLRKNMDGAAK